MSYYGFYKLELDELIYRHVQDKNLRYNVSKNEEIGLDAEYRRPQDAYLPFELTIKMPPFDMGKRGYSKQFIEELVSR